MTDFPLPQSPDDPRKVVRSFEADESGQVKAVFGRVGVQEINYKGRFGALTSSTTENDITIGDKYFAIEDAADRFRIGDDVLISSPDPDGFMWGEISGKDTVWEPARIRVFIDDVSNLTGRFQDWEIQVVARPKPGIEKDISLSSIDPTGAGPFTYTVTAGKFFPIGGKLLIKPNTDRSIALLASVKAYSGISLVVEKQTTNATVSQSYTSWSIALLDAPGPGVPVGQISGLRVTRNASDPVNDIDITAGSIRDSTDTVDLKLPAALTKKLDAVFAAGTNQGAQVVSANLAGTISSSGSNVTGTGTAFDVDFSDSTTSLAGFAAPFRHGAITASNGNRSDVNIITATSLTTNSDLSATNLTYKRGATAMTASGVNFIRYVIMLARKDTDGTTEVLSATVNAAGTPDLESGYTLYGIIAYVYYNSIIQHIQGVADAEFISDAKASRTVPVVLEAGAKAAAASHNLLWPAGWENFGKIVLRLSNVAVSTDAAEVNMRLSQDGAAFLSGVADYGWIHYDDPAAGGEATVSDVSDSEIELMLNVGNLSSEGGDVEITFLNPAATARLNGCNWQGRYVNATPAYVDVRGKGLIRSAAGAIKGAQILASAGNVSFDYTIIGHP